MKKSNLSIIIAIITLLSIQSCKKNEVQKVGSDSKANEYSDEINILKAHLARTTGVDPSDVEFDEKRKMFILFGNDQITYDELKAIYQESLKK